MKSNIISIKPSPVKRKPDYRRYEEIKRRIQSEAVDHRQYQEMIAKAAEECGV